MARNYVQTKDYRLAGAGIAATDTSIVLTSMELPNSAALVAMTDFGDIGFITLEPETDREENASFTGITQNANGTATLTGVTRGLTFVSPSTTDTNLRKSHSGGTIVRVSNSVQFYENLANRYNTQSIFEVWSFTAGKNPKYLTQPASFGDLDLIDKAFLSTNVYDYFVDTGAADAIVITPTTALAAYTAGNHFFIKVVATNTGATTININGLGVKSLKKSVTLSLDAGDILIGQVILVCYDGTNFQLIGGSVGSSGGSSTVTGIPEGTYFDDFTNWLLTDNTSGTQFHASGNFYSPSSSNTYSTETDHPGIVTIPEGPGNVADVIGFIAGGQSGSGDGGAGLIPVGSNFKFTYVGRSTRTGASFDTIIGLTDDTSAYDLYVRFNNGSSATKIEYWNGGSTISTVNLPVSGSWFTLVFDYIASTGVITVSIDGTTIFSEVAVFTDTQVGFRFGSVAGTAGTKLDTDSVRTETRPDTTTGIQTKTVALTPAEIKILNATPKELIAAPGVGMAVVPLGITYSFDYGSVQYTAGNDIRTSFSTTTGAALDAGIGTGQINAASNSITNCSQPLGNDDNIVANDSVILRNIGAEYATGDGTLKVFMNYKIINL